jgi:ABC-type transporter Mla subunit MlaD
MAGFDAIAAALRQQRRDLDELAEGTATRSAQTAGLLKKIEELRRRAEETQQRFEAPAPKAVR